MMKPSRQLLRSTLLAILGGSLLSSSAFAQFSSNTATRSNTGTTGAGVTTGFGTGTSGANSGGMFGSGQGANSSGLGQSGQGANGQARQINMNSQLGINPSTFLGQGNSQQNFLGRNQRTQTQSNNQNRQNNNNRGQGNFGQNDNNNQNGQGQQTQDPKRAIRPQFRVAFDEMPSPSSTTEIRSTLQPRFDSLSQTPALRSVAYELDAEGVVVLRGSVDTPSQRRLAENVVRLEPGVKKIRNELTLNEPAPTK